MRIRNNKISAFYINLQTKYHSWHVFLSRDIFKIVIDYVPSFCNVNLLYHILILKVRQFGYYYFSEGMEHISK